MTRGQLREAVERTANRLLDAINQGVPHPKYVPTLPVRDDFRRSLLGFLRSSVMGRGGETNAAPRMVDVSLLAASVSAIGEMAQAYAEVEVKCGLDPEKSMSRIFRAERDRLRPLLVPAEGAARLCSDDAKPRSRPHIFVPPGRVQTHSISDIDEDEL